MNSEFLLYHSDDGQIKIQVHLEDTTVWLTQADMTTLFQSSKSNISEHIKHIFEEGELAESSTVRKFRTVRKEGSRQIERDLQALTTTFGIHCSIGFIRVNIENFLYD